MIKNALAKMIRNTAIMKEMTQPLDSIGIDSLSFLRHYDNGYVCNLTSIDGWLEYYYKSALYESSEFEDRPSKYISGMFFFTDVCHSKVIVEGRAQFDSHGCVVASIRKNTSTTHYFFSVSKLRNNSEIFYSQKKDHIYKFIYYFEKKMKEIVENCIAPRKGLYPCDYIESSFTKNYSQRNDKNFLKDIKSSIQKLSKFPHLTPKEEIILSSLLKGLSTKEIATINFIGTRTVETHIDNIKSKFVCRTSLELVSIVYKDYYEYALGLLNINSS